MLFVLFFLYGAALVPRVIDITEPAPQVDEIHWQDRSYVVRHSFRDGLYTKFSSHLGHPGIPAALMMAAGQEAAYQWNKRFAPAPGAPGYLDALSGSRLANALFSSLIAPLFFFLACFVFPVGLALTGALLIAFDPQLVAAGRLAHLDSSLAVFVCASVFCYWLAVERRSTALKLVAGVLFGLSIATKPNSAALVPAFLCFKVLRNLITPRAGDNGERNIFSWSDVWAVFVAQLVFAAIFTKFWVFHPGYWRTLGVKSSVADALHALGLQLQQHWIITLSAILIAAVLGLHVLRSRSAAVFRRHSAHLLLFAAALFLLELVFPQVPDNMIRFWLRAASYQKMSHVSFGWTWPEPPGGYFGILTSKLPLFTLVFVAAGLFLFAKAVMHRTLAKVRGSAVLDSANSPQLTCLLLLFLSALIWTLFLQTSTKQTIRYLLPILPALFAFAASGLLAVSHTLFSFAPGAAANRSRMAAAASSLLVALNALFTLPVIHPDYLLYQNSLRGGLAAGVKSGYRFATAGFNEALTILHEKAKEASRVLDVAILADRDVVEATYARLYPLKQERKLRFKDGRQVPASDYVLTSTSLEPMFAAKNGVQVLGLPKIFGYTVKGVEVTSIYSVPALDFQTPYRRFLHASPRHTGRPVKTEMVLQPGSADPAVPAKALAADPGKHARGFLFFGENVRVLPGAYVFSLSAALPLNFNSSALPPDTAVLQFQVDERCQQTARVKDLTPGRLQAITVRCSFEQESKPQMRAFWDGTVPVVLRDIVIERAP